MRELSEINSKYFKLTIFPTGSFMKTIMHSVTTYFKNRPVDLILYKRLKHFNDKLLTFTYTWPHFTKHTVSVVPDAIKPQDLSVQFQELFQFVK